MVGRGLSFAIHLLKEKTGDCFFPFFFWKCEKVASGCFSVPTVRRLWFVMQSCGSWKKRPNARFFFGSEKHPHACGEEGSILFVMYMSILYQVYCQIVKICMILLLFGESMENRFVFVRLSQSL